MIRGYGFFILALLTACTPITPIVSPQNTPAVSVPLTLITTPTANSVTPAPTYRPPKIETVPEVLIFPEPLFAGDHLSLNITPPFTSTAQVTVSFPDGAIWQENVLPQGFDMRPRASGVWIWTVPTYTTHSVFTITLSSSLTATGSTAMWFIPFQLQDPTTKSPPEPTAQWALTETHQLRFHYLTHSAAARDLPHIITVANQAYATVTSQFGEPDKPLDFYFLDRVLGQGGYATSQWIAVTYTDRDYTPSGLGIVLRHELTHRLDDAIGCRNAPSLLREGLAVYIAGGHYHPESLPRKAAALLQTRRYIPLDILGKDFYTHQHEIGYLEAGSLLTYIVDEFGHSGLEQICRAAASAEGDEPTQLSAGAQAFNWSWSELEQHYRHWLQAIHPSAAEAALLQAEWHMMDSMRAYQASYDPGANFQLGIFFNPREGEAQNITADFVRRPRTPEAITIELMLKLAQTTLVQHHPAEAEQLLTQIDRVLTQGFSATSQAVTLHQIVLASLARGYEPYHLVPNADPITGNTYYLVYALERTSWPKQCQLTASKSNGEWIVTGPQP